MNSVTDLYWIFNLKMTPYIPSDVRDVNDVPLNAGIYNPVSSLCDLVNVADHVEGDLGQVIVLAGKDSLEARDGLIDGDEFARVVGEDLSDLKKNLRFEYVR